MVPGVAEAAVLAVDATDFTAGDPVVPPRVSMARQEEPVSFCKWGGGEKKESTERQHAGCELAMHDDAPDV